MPDLDNITQRAQASNLQSKVDDAINRANSITGGQQKNRTDEEIEEVAKGFEGIFFSLMLKEMKKTVDKAGFMGEDSSASQMYEDMMDDHLAEVMGKEGLGIGKMVKDFLKEQAMTTFDPDSPEIQQKLAERVAQYQQIQEKTKAGNK
ncbi:MAG: rod-binding protein [Planctomycetota bacterium]|jgi:Rod binding domain-containing protein|nr:rod-binding protein [Planctomycetota bacterium]MDP7250393.1 rod-binding protein [Planctomycetota bacterium]